MSKKKSAPQQRRSRADRKQTPKRMLQLAEDEQTDSSYTMFSVHSGNTKTDPFKVTMTVSGATLEMEVDTGAASSIISLATYYRLWSRDQAAPLRNSTKRLCTYTKEPLKVVITVTVQYINQTAELDLVVVAGTATSLLGRDWLRVISWTGRDSTRFTMLSVKPCSSY